MKDASGKLYVLATLQGKLLSLDPATDTFKVIRTYGELKIWDVQAYNEELNWFMGNSPKPKIGYRIKEVPKKHLAKFS